MKRISFLVLLTFSQCLQAQWNYEVAPYLWASSLSGTQETAGFKFKVHEPFSELIKELDFGAMLWLAAYQNDFGVFFNGVYSKVSEHLDLHQIDINTSSILSIDSVGVSYKIIHDNKWTIEPYLGARYTINKNKLTIDSHSFIQKNNWTDAIIGARINLNITPFVNVEGAADYGKGNNSNSYNVMALIGYQSPHHFKNARFYLGYRLLHQNFEHGQGLNFYDWDMDILGPVVGVMFKF